LKKDILRVCYVVQYATAAVLLLLFDAVSLNAFARRARSAF